MEVACGTRQSSVIVLEAPAWVQGGSEYQGVRGSEFRYMAKCPSSKRIENEVAYVPEALFVLETMRFWPATEVVELAEKLSFQVM